MTDEPARVADDERERVDLGDPASYEHRVLECDLVMKGGITSGVVYPRAVAELATVYRFRNIGGTSAGAISAAAAAAAEVRGDAAGFVQLAELPSRLGGELEALFRPQRRCRRVLRLLVAATRKGGPLAKVGSLAMALLPFLATPRGLAVVVGFAVPAALLAVGLGGAVATYWVVGLALLGLCIGLAACSLMLWKRREPRWARPVAAVLGCGSIAALVWITSAHGRAGWGVAGWLLISLVSLAVATIVAVVLEAIRALSANDYGLVGGAAHETESGDVEPLTEWLHTLLQTLAGRNVGDAPLTFRDLAAGGVNLTLLTTCVSRGRTYYLPYDFDEDDADDRFWFDPDELRRSMPPDVIQYLCDLPRERTWIDDALAPLVPLPRADALPVVTAVRMSLSFPALISAVPLRAIDWTLVANRDARAAWRAHVRDGSHGPSPVPPDAEKCWFSDGGIISNFPVHLFDSLLPTCPTFGINLRDFHPDRVQFDRPEVAERHKIYRPHTNGSGISEWWTRWETGGVRGLTGFAGAILDTIQNWSDNDQARVPGYRDRIVHVSHGKSEGGINLAMPAPVIEKLADRGREAALELSAAFARPEPPPDVDTGWRNHKWIRLRSSLALLAGELQSISAAYPAPDPTGVETYRDLVRLHHESTPSYQATKRQHTTMRELVEGSAEGGGGLAGAAARLAASTPLATDAPGPAPTLRVTPGHSDAPEGGSR